MMSDSFENDGDERTRSRAGNYYASDEIANGANGFRNRSGGGSVSGHNNNNNNSNNPGRNNGFLDTVSGSIYSNARDQEDLERDPDASLRRERDESVSPSRLSERLRGRRRSSSTSSHDKAAGNHRAGYGKKMVAHIDKMTGDISVMQYAMLELQETVEDVSKQIAVHQQAISTLADTVTQSASIVEATQKRVPKDIQNAIEEFMDREREERKDLLAAAHWVFGQVLSGGTEMYDQNPEGCDKPVITRAKQGTWLKLQYPVVHACDVRGIAYVWMCARIITSETLVKPVYVKISTEDHSRDFVGNFTYSPMVDVISDWIKRLEKMKSLVPPPPPPQPTRVLKGTNPGAHTRRAAPSSPVLLPPPPPPIQDDINVSRQKNRNRNHKARGYDKSNTIGRNGNGNRRNAEEEGDNEDGDDNDDSEGNREDQYEDEYAYNRNEDDEA